MFHKTPQIILMHWQIESYNSSWHIVLIFYFFPLIQIGGYYAKLEGQ